MVFFVFLVRYVVLKIQKGFFGFGLRVDTLCGAGYVFGVGMWFHLLFIWC